MSDQIKVGDGATMGVGSDCYPYTVVEIKSPRCIIVQSDNYTRTDKNGLSESQEYDYSPNPQGGKVTLTLRSNDRWVRKGESMRGGSRWTIGSRRAYQCPSF
tara:strand:- start:8 stop:313 length:306 start_codon:yes stop_codon:yes gene_type:complete